MKDFGFVSPEERQEVEPPVPGLSRQTAMAGEGHWVGFVTTEPGMNTGWHHHSDNDTFVYIISGRARIDFGPRGEQSMEGGPGTFGFVPKGRIHREVNSGDEPNAIVVMRVGSGPPVVPADGPEPAGG